MTTPEAATDPEREQKTQSQSQALPEETDDEVGTVKSARRSKHITATNPTTKIRMGSTSSPSSSDSSDQLSDTSEDSCTNTGRVVVSAAHYVRSLADGP